MKATTLLLTLTAMGSASGGVLINVGPEVGSVDGMLQSFTLDSYSFIHNMSGYNFEDERSIKLVKSMGKSYLRIGGTAGDALTFNETKPVENSYIISEAEIARVCKFSNTVGWPIIFGLNIMVGYNQSSDHSWDPTNADKLITYAKSISCPIIGWELGNEDNLGRPGQFSTLGKGYFTPKLVSDNFVKLSALLRSKYDSVGQGTTNSPFLIGPDCTREGVVGSRAGFFRQVLGNLSLTNTQVNAATYHQYFIPDTTLADMMNATYLDRVAAFASEANSARNKYAPDSQVWIGESSIMLQNKSAPTTLCGKVPAGTICYFGGIFPWLDKLGLASLYNHSVVARQTFSTMVRQVRPSGRAEVSPGYWTDVMIKNLLQDGARTVNITLTGTDVTPNLRSYGFMGPQQQLITFVLNLVDDDVELSFPKSHQSGKMYVFESYPTPGILTSNLTSCNGQFMTPGPDGDLPPFPSVAVTGSITLKGLSATFMVLDPSN
eukprot:TRINITY_DN1369_c0_g6_i1.p1 TRINITY_DN1369_c0_g6~~TRINITY_DN1369_c0_g6_i1.p1  ORF type:complete len:491 (+),score=101.16 TRINITY_DN1369_c0_g6_i1:48-1520(+)